MALIPVRDARQSYPPFDAIFSPFKHGSIRYGRTASAADRAVLVELRLFLAGIHTICTLPRRLIGARTCSSAGAGSWSSGPNSCGRGFPCDQVRLESEGSDDLSTSPDNLARQWYVTMTRPSFISRPLVMAVPIPARPATVFLGSSWPSPPSVWSTVCLETRSTSGG